MYPYWKKFWNLVIWILWLQPWDALLKYLQCLFFLLWFYHVFYPYSANFLFPYFHCILISFTFKCKTLKGILSNSDHSFWCSSISLYLHFESSFIPYFPFIWNLFIWNLFSLSGLKILKVKLLDASFSKSPVFLYFSSSISVFLHVWWLSICLL